MTYPATREDGPGARGGRSALRSDNPNYPELGFNPAAGSTVTVRTLHKKLIDSAETLEEAHGVVSKLMDGSYWKGDAAVAFREAVQDGPLSTDLKNAAHSMRKAARQLDRWEGELEEFQHRAKRLNEDAKHARAVLDAAQGRADRAQNDHDLNKKGAAHGHASDSPAHADAKVEEARADLDRILKKARSLSDEHAEKASYHAKKIRDATAKLAPQEPGGLEKLGEWFADNWPDILSFAAGVIGLIALFVVTGGTAAVLLLLAAALSAGAVTGRLMDPTVRASLGDGFTKGEFDSDFWSNAIGLTADAVGMAPGIGAVAKGGFATARAAGASAEVLTLGQRMALLGEKTMDQARAISELGNPVLDLVVRGARDAARAGEAVELGSGILGVGTGGYGLLSSAIEKVENDGVADGATGVDGARLSLDSGGFISLARYAFS